MAMGIGLAAEGDVRVVPQFAWGKEGKVSPDGRFSVCVLKDTIRVVDNQHGCLAWIVRLVGASDVAFSPDSRHLAASGEEHGLLMKLSEGVPSCPEALAGSVIAFSSESRSLYIARRPGRKKRPSATPVLAVVSLSGRITGIHPLKMSWPAIIEVLADGKSVRIVGTDGDRRRVRTAEQTIDLATGESTVTLGPIVRELPRDRKKQTLDPLPGCDKRRTAGQVFEDLYWDGPSGICVMHGGGMPEGGVLKAWDVRRGRFMSTVGTGNNVGGIRGFLRPGVLTAYTWHDGKKDLAVIDLVKGDRRQTGLDGRCFLPSPDGKHVAAISGDEWSSTGKLTVWRLEDRTPLFSAVGVPYHRPPKWTGDGSCLMEIRVDKEANRFAVELHYLDGAKVERVFAPDPEAPLRKPEVPEQETVLAERVGVDKDTMLRVKMQRLGQEAWLRTRIWDMDADAQVRRLALGVGCKDGRVAVMDIASKVQIAELRGIPGGVSAVLFVDDGVVLAGGREGQVRLWDYEENRVLWSAETGEDLVQFGHVRGSKYVVCQHDFRSATVLDMSRGWTLRRAPRLKRYGSYSILPWTSPLPISDGSVALEVEPGVFQVCLVVTRSGERLLTYCPFAGDQWIVYTPEGWWDGSELVHDWVKWYRGASLLDEKEAERFRDRSRIDAVLARVFKAKNREA
jgi:WD40 repeat protein